MTIKNFSFRHWESIPKFFIAPLPVSVHDVKQKARLELCVPLAVTILLANYCTRWHCNFKGLSQDGGRPKLAENLLTSPINNELSNKTFSLIHLAGQYLKWDSYRKIIFHLFLFIHLCKYLKII